MSISAAHETGLNYYFYDGDPVPAVISPDGDFLSYNDILPMEGVLTNRTVIPLFLYKIRTQGEIPARDVQRPAYLKNENGKLSSRFQLSEPAIQILNDKQNIFEKFPLTPEGKFPWFIKRCNLITQVGVSRKDLTLYKVQKKRYNKTFFLFLRDIINPQSGEESILELIDKLHFGGQEKLFLNKLVKIMYAGTSEEESKIVSSLFSHEPEFARSLQISVFSIEILPVIHGNFLFGILAGVDDQIIKNELDSFSPEVKKTITKNISVNRMRTIGILKKEKNSQISLTELIETEIYRQFSRKVYYRDGENIYYITECPEQTVPEPISVKLLPVQYNFSFKGIKLEFIGCDTEMIYVKTYNFISTLRADIIHGIKKVSTVELFNIPENHIFALPNLPNTRLVTGAGFGPVPFEFILQTSDY